MIDKRPLLYYFIALLFGCFSALFLSNNILLGAVFAASIFVYIYFAEHSKLVFIAAAFFILGSINYYLYYRLIPSENCSVRLVKHQSFNYLVKYKGRKILLNGKLEGYKEGEILYINGEFTKAPQYDKGIIGEFHVSGIVGTRSDILAKIYAFKERLYNKYKEEIGTEAAGELMAASFGDDSKIENSSMSEMSKLGIIHVISVSGLHMAVIYKLCEGTLGFTGGMILSVLYCIFTGGEVSTVRSLIMIMVFKLSKKVYKNYDPLSSLSLSGIILLFMNPSYALDLGAILSFLSVLGIFLFYSRVQRLLYRLPDKLNAAISLTLSAQVFSLPVGIMIFNSVSTASLQGNIFLVPLYSLLLLLGNISMILSGVDFAFKFTCKLINLVYTAIQGGKEILLFTSTGLMYMSYVDAIMLLILYISYMLHRKVHKKFMWLPLFSVVFYLGCSFAPVTEFQYVKIGSSRGVVYRSGFKSVLFLDKSAVKEEPLMICKKLRVLTFEDIGKSTEVVYNHHKKRINIKFNKDMVLIDYVNGETGIKTAFVKDYIPVAKDYIYDIIFLNTKDNSYSYYDELSGFKIIGGKVKTR
ncbi:ComEC/Rec2 family competence protein [Clostridium thermarum]|uniref:ComEC/Rec2 family competence protein n=1 Tax=Clostridium thermarum TaxID=1716543 RepID=UPI0013D397F5|nr:ComEC/Rec2 family competence protein [Clostridium thermarum]